MKQLDIMIAEEKRLIAYYQSLVSINGNGLKYYQAELDKHTYAYNLLFLLK